MSIFRNRVQFNRHDPLDNGLREEIAAEQREADAFSTLDDVSGEQLASHWSMILNDARKDPDWIDFYGE